jgi:hypothetical protein
MSPARGKRPSTWPLSIPLILILLGAAPAAPSIKRDLDLKDDCGAVGDGYADDSQALKTCLRRMQEVLENGGPAVLHIRAGVYRITGANGPMPTIERHGGTILGEGPHASYVVLAPDYSGDLFSWSEAWTAQNYGPHSNDALHDRSGPTIQGLQIDGSIDAPRRQNAFVFYDRNDHVLMRDVEVYFLNGECLSIGRSRSSPLGYVRESSFFNVKCFSTGTRDAPAVDISSTSGPGSDATNQLDFYKLAVFDAKGDGVVVRNPNPASATRRIRFFGLRVERTGQDGFVIGGSGDRGQVADIGIHELTGVSSGGAALHIGAGSNAPEPYQITVLGGSLGPNNNTAIRLDSGRLVEIDLSHVDAPVIKGRKAGINIRIHGNGNESAWDYEGESPGGIPDNSLR